MLGMAVALAAEPNLLLLDEPFTGMNPEETRRMMALVRRIRDEGATVILVEHDMQAVMNLCDVITVMNFGALLVEAAPHRQQQAVQRDVVLDIRMPHRAEEDGVEPAQRVQPVRVHHPAVLEVVVGAPRELGVRKLNAEPALRGVQHLDAFLDDFRPDAVSAYDCDLVFAHARACLRSRVGWCGFSHAPVVHATIGTKKSLSFGEERAMNPSPSVRRSTSRRERVPRYGER